MSVKPDSGSKQRSDWIGAALDFGPILLFFLAYFRFKDETFLVLGTEYTGFVAVTAAFIPVLLAATAASWLIRRHISRMQLVAAVLVVVFGGLSVWLNDERFFKIKPTIVYLVFAALEAFGIWRGRFAVEFVMGHALALTSDGWSILARRILVFWLALALANELVWRNFPTETWVSFKTFVLPAAIFVFLISQHGIIRRHSRTEEPE